MEEENDPPRIRVRQGVTKGYVLWPSRISVGLPGGLGGSGAEGFLGLVWFGLLAAKHLIKRWPWPRFGAKPTGTASQQLG
jgi:hypothetical protein